MQPEAGFLLPGQVHQHHITGCGLPQERKAKYSYNSTSSGEHRHSLPAYRVYHLQGACPFQRYRPGNHERQNSAFNQKEGLIPRSLLRNKLFQDMEEVIY